MSMPLSRSAWASVMPAAPAPMMQRSVWISPDSVLSSRSRIMRGSDPDGPRRKDRPRRAPIPSRRRPRHRVRPDRRCSAPAADALRASDRSAKSSAASARPRAAAPASTAICPRPRRPAMRASPNISLNRRSARLRESQATGKARPAIDKAASLIRRRRFTFFLYCERATSREASKRAQHIVFVSPIVNPPASNPTRRAKVFQGHGCSNLRR